MAVILETSIGDITIDLYIKERPRCCLNFLKLCKLKKYNFNLFHTIQHNFIAQTGDPTGSGKGGESCFKFLFGDQASYFESEAKPRIKHIKKGAVSMVNNGTNMHGSQFFITLAEDLDYLDGQQHTVFGEVSEGFDVIDTLNEVITNKDNRPYKEIRIFHTVIIDDPLPDPAGLLEILPLRSPSPIKEQLDKVYIGVDEEIDEDADLKPEEIEEKRKAKEASANAKLLEMIGDLPDADIAPPENVLFVCKLNSVTTSEDLEVIFSRFGPIENCEIIKDQKTQESLQYAFIEFKNAEDCEKAYFKMDNVLIDERRIHVDFSQSVSKVKWPRGGKQATKAVDEPAQPQFRIKDPDARRLGGYDFVFDAEPPRDKIEKMVSNSKNSSNTKPPKKSHKHNRSDDHKKSPTDDKTNKKSNKKSKRRKMSPLESHSEDSNEESVSYKDKEYLTKRSKMNAVDYSDSKTPRAMLSQRSNVDNDDKERIKEKRYVDRSSKEDVNESDRNKHRFSKHSLPKKHSDLNHESHHEKRSLKDNIAKKRNDQSDESNSSDQDDHDDRSKRVGDKYMNLSDRSNRDKHDHRNKFEKHPIDSRENSTHSNINREKYAHADGSASRSYRRPDNGRDVEKKGSVKDSSRGEYANDSSKSSRHKKQYKSSRDQEDDDDESDDWIDSRHSNKYRKDSKIYKSSQLSKR